jgi:hypothetical protein
MVDRGLTEKRVREGIGDPHFLLDEAGRAADFQLSHLK